MKEIGNRIKLIRAETGLKQGEFAKKLEISQGLLSGIEGGNELLSDRVKKIICFEFGIDENWLLTGEGKMIRPIDDEEKIIKIFRKLEPEGKEQIKAYLKERLKLQNFEKDGKKSWDYGIDGKDASGNPVDSDETGEK
jgi:transcriptional regulator with XRE-family HTH domain